MRPVGYIAAALAGALLMVGAFALGRATGGGDPVTAPTSTTTTSVSPTTIASPTTLPATTLSPTTLPATTIAPSTTSTTTTRPPLDPVADVAAAVGPAVVQIETISSIGSGVIYDDEGHILTAAHVLNGLSDVVTVRLADGRVFTGVVVGAHEPTDVAVIEIEAADLPVARLAVDQPLQIGQLAVALGSPFGLDQTVTAGIVSSVDRLVGGVAMVQTDAAINPGNSGGPLLDRSGSVIGINDLIFSRTGVNEGVGFAISIDLAAFVAEQIVAGTEVRLGFLGVFVADEAGDVPGALLERIQIGSPAAAAGLRTGDIVIAFDGEPVVNSDALGAKVMRTRPGRVVIIDVVRGGGVLGIEVTIGETRA